MMKDEEDQGQVRSEKEEEAREAATNLLPFALLPISHFPLLEYTTTALVTTCRLSCWFLISDN